MKKIIPILKIVIIVFAMEIFIFNINSFRLIFRNYEKKQYNEDEFETVQYKNKNSEGTCIEINGIEEVVGTVKIEIEAPKQLTYYISYTDETSKNYRDLPSKVYVYNIERSKYTTCYLSGKSEKIKINFPGIKKENLKIKNITINENVPINFSKKRFVFILAMALLIYGVLKSEQFKKPYEDNNKLQKVVLCVTLIAFIIVTMIISKNAEKEKDIYDSFVNALVQGKISLLEEPPKQLSELEDPYDATARTFEYFWDVSFYNGHYYVYFGILPFLILPVPYRLITGTNMPVNIGVLVFSIIALISLFKIIVLLYKRWFKNVDFSYLVLAIIGTLLGSFVFFINVRPAVYEFAFASMIAFCGLGIWLMLEATSKNKVNYIQLCLSATCLALAVACRPTSLLVSIIFIIQVIKILRENIKQKKDIMKLILAVGIPYLIVGIALMIYNYIRFDSIFEFGINYQLTSNNIAKLGNRIMSLPTGILTQFFKIPPIKNVFPFYELTDPTVISFFGFVWRVPSYGIFILFPINFLLFLLPGLRKKVKEKEAYNNVVLFTVVALIIALFDIYMLGTSIRYIMDYSWILSISSYLTLFMIVSNLKSEYIKRYILKFVLIVTIFTLYTNLIVQGMLRSTSYLKNNKPSLFYEIRYEICFWE